MGAKHGDCSTVAPIMLIAFFSASLIYFHVYPAECFCGLATLHQLLGVMIGDSAGSEVF